MPRNGLNKKAIFIHLPKIILILACFGYEIYLFITYGSYFLKYFLFPNVLIIGSILVIILFLLLLRLLRGHKHSKRIKDFIQTKKIRYLLVYYILMAFVIFIPTIVFSYSISLMGFLFSYPLLCLLIIELIFLLIIREPKSIENWERRFEIRKGIWVGILVTVLLSPVSVHFLVKNLPFFSFLTTTTEVEIETHYDSSVFQIYPEKIQRQVLDNASSFSLNNSWFYNGSVGSYVSDVITEKQLSNKGIPSFIVVSVDYISYISRITVLQTNFTLNSTIFPYNQSRITSAEQSWINWYVYDDEDSYWINPGINFSLQVESSVFLTGPLFYCEFIVYTSTRDLFATRCTIYERCLLDSAGQILLIVRQDSCFMLI